jgi:hypothetical protein
MKPSLLGIFCSAVLALAAGTVPAHAAEAEGHVLAKKNPAVVVGSKLTMATSSLLKDGKYTFTSDGEKIEGTGTVKSEEIVTIECLSPTRFRRIQTTKEENTRMEMLGETVDEPGEAGPLLGVPVILEKQEKDGSYTATLEKGEATEEQKKELKEIAVDAAVEDELVMYGEQPRKPGDKWDVDVTKLSDFFDGEDMRGTMAVEFVEAKEFDGARCAVLKCSFELSGTLKGEDIEDGKMTFKGTTLLHRSLADHVDLESKTEGRMTVSTKTEDMPVEMAGPMTVNIRSKLAKPER